jgi:glucose-6-phosphate 1-dehydrogenase
VGLTEPYVRLSTTLNGRERTAEIRQLEACSTPPRFTAYAHLILDMLNTNPMLFIRGEEAEEAWRIIDPVMNAWTAETSPCRNTQPAQHHQDPPDDPQQIDTAATSPTLGPGQDRHAQPAGSGTVVRTRTAS